MGTFQFQVANCDLKFIPVDAHGFVCSDKSGAAIQPFAEFYPAPTALTTAENRALYKARRIEFEDNMMHTGQSYQGMFVRIVGKHSRKGLFGVVKGYKVFPLPEKPKRPYTLVWPEIELQIQLDGSLAKCNAKLENLLDQ
jgi:hypothetical protein